MCMYVATCLLPTAQMKDNNDCLVTHLSTHGHCNNLLQIKPHVRIKLQTQDLYLKSLNDPNYLQLCMYFMSFFIYFSMLLIMYIVYKNSQLYVESVLYHV